MQTNKWPYTRPLIKWAGGKTAELQTIRDHLPKIRGRYIEPFFGGGALAFALDEKTPILANDRSEDLIALYQNLKNPPTDFISITSEIGNFWQKASFEALEFENAEQACVVIKNLSHGVTHFLGKQFSSQVETMIHRSWKRKQTFLNKLKDKNVEIKGEAKVKQTAVLSGIYTAMRNIFNQTPPGVHRAALFWFLREFCYGGMFRTNSKGEFNVPYGGASYNNRTLLSRIEQIKSKEIKTKLDNINFTCLDFEMFLEQVKPQKEDFIFFDPPYDSPFSRYDGNSFNKQDHQRLAQLQTTLACPSITLIAQTPFVEQTYCGIGTQTIKVSKTYQSTIKDRWNRQTTLLLIKTNF